METSTSWGDWFQGVLGGVVDKAATAQWVQPYEVERLQLQALGTTGQLYREGQPTGTAGTVAGINTGTLLLIGAALVAVLLLKD